MQTTRRFAAAAAAALVAMLVAAAPAEAAKAARLTGYDSLAVTGGRARLRFKVERENFIRWDLRGVTVEFRTASGTLLGTAVSAGNGYADLDVTIGQTAGDAWISGRIAPGGTYAAPEAWLLVAIRAPSERVVVTDIDHTISAAGVWDRLTKPNRDLPPVRGAVAGTHDVRDSATIVYVTARDDRDAAKTKSWLAYWGFPEGPVYFSDDPYAWVDPRPYKSATVRTLHAVFPDMPCGFGDLPGDARAYHDNGLAAFVFDTHDAGPFPPYARVYADWEELRAANAAGLVPDLVWATSFR